MVYTLFVKPQPKKLPELPTERSALFYLLRIHLQAVSWKAPSDRPLTHCIGDGKTNWENLFQWWKTRKLLLKTCYIWYGVSPKEPVQGHWSWGLATYGTYGVSAKQPVHWFYVHVLSMASSAFQHVLTAMELTAAISMHCPTICEGWLSSRSTVWQWNWLDKRGSCRGWSLKSTSIATGQLLVSFINKYHNFTNMPFLRVVSWNYT